jgi:hypothetical protein
MQQRVDMSHYKSVYECFGSRDRDWLWADLPRARSSSLGRGKIFLLFRSSRPVLVYTQPPVQWVTGTLSSGIKRPGREADRSSPISAEVKNVWIYKSTTSYVKYRNKFIFYLFISVKSKHYVISSMLGPNSFHFIFKYPVSVYFLKRERLNPTPVQTKDTFYLYNLVFRASGSIFG